MIVVLYIPFDSYNTYKRRNRLGDLAKTAQWWHILDIIRMERLYIKTVPSKIFVLLVLYISSFTSFPLCKDLASIVR